MNVRLLRRIAKVIQEKPDQLDMRWLHTKDDEAADIGCATAHCICGWGAVLLGLEDIGTGSSAGNTFGLDWDQQCRLFFVHGWPVKFGRPYAKSKTPKYKAGVAAARIEHFIKTKGRE